MHVRTCWQCSALPQSSSLTLRLEQCQHISLPHWSLNVTDDVATGVINELNANLETSTESPRVECHKLTIIRSTDMKCGSSAAECWTQNRKSPGL